MKIQQFIYVDDLIITLQQVFFLQFILFLFFAMKNKEQYGWKTK